MMKCDKHTQLTALKKARSHIDKIIKMIENEEYCIDIIQQLNAVIGYLRSARIKRLEQHLQTCFMEGMGAKSKAKKEKLIDELLQVMKIAR